jgi:hypothetical protein
MIKEDLKGLLEETMDRKKFLTFSGAIVLGIVGVTGLINILGKSRSSQSDSQYPIQTDGYGGSDYGR